MSLESEVELIRRLPLFAKIDLPMLKLLCFSSERLTFEKGQVTLVVVLLSPLRGGRGEAGNVIRAIRSARGMRRVSGSAAPPR